MPNVTEFAVIFDAVLAADSRVEFLLKEAGELVAIFSAIGKTAKKST
jgi:hypothetical protein